MNGLWESVVSNVVFLLQFLGLIAAIVVVAYLVEKCVTKKKGTGERILSTRKTAMIGMFSALATILMMFEIPMPFAPSFYKLDFSEIPVLIGTFAFGPVAGVLIEFIKIILKLLFKGTSTAFVGELANFAVGCSFVLPASIIYYIKKSKKSAIVACAVGTIVLTVFGTSFNAIYLLPKFAELYGMPLDALIGMGTAINPRITNIVNFVILAVAPLNLIKGTSVSFITMLVYKKLSPIIKSSHGRNA